MTQFSAEGILAQLNEIFRKVVNDPNVELKRLTTAQDVEDWDLLNHITYIVAIEKHFKIKFTRSEIRAWANVGEMCDAVLTKLN